MSTETFYTDFAPSRAVQAFKKAVMHLYCCEDFSVIGKLGSGFFANVYLVHHQPSKVKMALKISNEGNVLRREIEFLSALRHNNVQRLYGACIVSGRLACLSEYFNGGNLVDLLTCSSAHLSWSTRISLAHDIISGIGHLHDHQLVHRDLSAQNILIRVNHPRNWSPQEEVEEHSEVLLVHDVPHHPVGCCGGSSCSAPSSPFLSPALSCNITYETETPPSPPLHFSPLLTIEQLTTSRSCNNTTCRNSTLNRPPNIHESWTTETYHLPKVAPLVSMTGGSGNGPEYTAVVGDLGVCLDLKDKNADPTITMGNPFCTAPECLKKVAPYSPAADIFSFGLLLCEIMTGLMNNGFNLPRTSDFGLDVNQLRTLPDCPAWLLQLVTQCCNVNFRTRPKVPEIAALLLSKLKAAENPRPLSPNIGVCVTKHTFHSSPTSLNSKLAYLDVSPPKRQSVLVTVTDTSEKCKVEPTVQPPLFPSVLPPRSPSPLSYCSVAASAITAQPPSKGACSLYKGSVLPSSSQRIVLPESLI